MRRECNFGDGLFFGHAFDVRAAAIIHLSKKLDFEKYALISSSRIKETTYVMYVVHMYYVICIGGTSWQYTM